MTMNKTYLENLGPVPPLNWSLVVFRADSLNFGVIQLRRMVSFEGLPMVCTDSHVYLCVGCF